jgi:hypothetical protein
MDNKYVTIIDNTGRNILGTLASETATEIDILNPVMISVTPQNGQFQVQLIPLFLAEFIAAKNDLRNFTYTYSKSNIALGKNFDVDVRITSQYDRIIEATNKPKAPVAGGDKPEVVKLFDE